MLGGHGCEAPFSAKFPGPFGTQTLFATTVPGGHLTQTVDPVLCEDTVPEGHGLHAVIPIVGA